MAENRFIVAATMRGQKIHLQQLCDGKNTFALARTFFHEHLIGSLFTHYIVACSCLVVVLEGQHSKH